jgi:hypothetical protein
MVNAMKLTLGILCALLLVCQSTSVLCSGGTAVPSQDYWMGLYSGSDKMGNLYVSIRPDKFEGKNVSRKDESLHVRMKSSCGDNSADLTHTVYVDSFLFPVFETMTGKTEKPVESGAQSMAVELRYGQDTIAVKMTIDGKTTTQSVPFAQGDRALAAAGYAYDMGATKLAVGEKLDLQYMHFKIDPASTTDSVACRTEPVVLSVLRRETVNVNGVSCDALVISEKDKKGYDTIKWRTDDGKIVKQETPKGGVTWLRETKEEAAKAL